MEGVSEDPLIIELRALYDEAVNEEAERVKALLETLPELPSAHGPEGVAQMVTFFEDQLKAQRKLEVYLNVTLIENNLFCVPRVTARYNLGYLKTPSFPLWWSKCVSWGTHAKAIHDKLNPGDQLIVDSFIYATGVQMRDNVCSAWKKAHPSIECAWTEMNTSWVFSYGVNLGTK